MRTRTTPLITAVLLTALASEVPAQSDSPRPKITRATDLPRHTYPVRPTASAVLHDSAAFVRLATRMEADLRHDLASYEITDRSTLKSFYGTLADLGLARGDYAVAVAYTDSLRIIEDKPALKLTAGLGLPALVAARGAAPDSVAAVFGRGFREQLEALPWDTVQAEVLALKAFLDLATPNSILGRAQVRLDPASRNGELSRELAQQLVRLRVTLVDWVPLRSEMQEAMSAVIAAHTVVKTDIWAPRDVSLDRGTGLTPVMVGIWDTGVDAAVFHDRMFINRGEVPGNGRDDDHNGFVDDVNGPAFDVESRPTTGALYPLHLRNGSEPEYRGYLKGYLDLVAGLQSDEAGALKQKFGATPPGQFKTLLENLNQYINYAHGTHVTGIAVRGNPAARVVVARASFDYRVPPIAPTIELVRRGVQEARLTVAYLRGAGARVVNMSWGGDPKSFEQDLEANHKGGTVEERQALARQLFDIWAGGLREAIAAAPDVLFVAAAGNDDGDNAFSEFVPASFDLPNLITVGAVDLAGDEAPFTSYGKVDVYANGYEVPSTVPGGTVQPLSGTSMAAPQVTNLAAKLLAVHPELTPVQLRQVILDATEERTIGPGKVIRLLHPARSFEIAGQHP